MDEQGGNDLLTVPEVAERLKVSAVTVSRWVKQGRLPALKVGPRAVRIRVDDLARVMAPTGATTGRDPETGAARQGALEPGQGIMGSSPDQDRWASPAAVGTREDRLSVAQEAQLLREKVLARRKGVPLPAAADEAGSGKKRRKAS